MLSDKTSSSSEVRQLREQVEEMETALDSVVKDMESYRKQIANAATDADQAGQLADSAMRGVSSCQDVLRRLGVEVDGVVRQGNLDKKDLARAVDEVHRLREVDESRLSDLIRRVEERADAFSMRTRDVDELRALLDELSDRTDDNFKSVEESARAVDVELTRQSSELGALRTDVAGLHENIR
uniref:Uncharacterized protein n=1 Tax=Lygus hesperus TaxID=30085 RepID=A0A146LLL4_LYGHE